MALRRRDQRKTTGAVLAAAEAEFYRGLAHLREQKRLMGELVDAVLRTAGFAAAAIPPTNNGDALPSDYAGFWMQLDDPMDGILLTAVGYPDEAPWNRQYLPVLQKAFLSVVGAEGLDYVKLAQAESTQLAICIPDATLQRLHGMFCA